MSMSYRFTFTPDIVRSLQIIERARERVRLTVLPPAVAERLRLEAKVRSTHFSTRIEGNRLTLMEVSQAVLEGKTFHGRERDMREVQNYYLALQQVETWVDRRQAITEDRIRKLHALLYRGRRAKATPYRDGQNVIRDAGGRIVYLPPEAKDVPGLMQELVSWINVHEKDFPIPVVAGVAHYQFVTIHPYYDGNGRTARALATWILYRGGYDLGRFYALEEFYAQDLLGYYHALTTHPHHNYYEGRANADITPWLVYFLQGTAVVFDRVAGEVSQQMMGTAYEERLRQLDRRARRVLSLFTTQNEITSRDVANVLGVSIRHARTLLSEWVGQGWLEIADTARKTRRYRLTAEYRKFIG